ncbi:MAG TPA: phosphate ABC transporter substrate-binding protein PstS [Pseudonocardiaceae bacterium]|nr:phosphate ABC transporter substrate-binding protein PstS [Pseudonocardiaceae bacterium]
MLGNTRSAARGCGPRVAAWLTAVAVLLGTQFATLPAAFAQGYVPISGAGSTWSFNALDQWRRNVDNNYQIKVNFAPSGSSDGRNQFKNGTVDFAVSEIEYGLTDGGVTDQPPAGRTFGYMPIVAGGTAFMYNLKIGNTRVTNLRLSGDVLAKIFAQQITTWSDPAIKADNPGLTLPARKIVPVVRSDGSGTTAQFTRWLAARHASTWDAYCDKAGKKVKPCGFTSNYPLAAGMEAKAGSQGVAGFVAQGTSEGSITYVEYSYAKNASFPVVKVLNEAGYYVEPKASNVAVALLKAQIRPDLTSDLSGVYTDGDKRTYPLSSYSYLIMPKNNNQNFTNEKGRTLAEFASYFLCEGQQQAEALGYSPLPLNLVQAGVDQVAQIPGSDGASVKLNRNDLSKCNNPTFSPDGTNLLARDAPQPAECDRKGGPTQCTTGTGGASAATPTSGGGPDAGGSPGTGGAGGEGSGGSASGTNGTNSTGGTGGTVAGATGSDGGPAAEIDPDTGQGTEGAASGAGSSSVSAVPVSVDVADNRRQMLLAMLAIVLLLGLVLGPPLVAQTMRSRGGPPA